MGGGVNVLIWARVRVRVRDVSAGLRLRRQEPRFCCSCRRRGRGWVKSQRDRIIPQIEIRQVLEPRQDGGCPSQTTDAIPGQAYFRKPRDSEEGTDIFQSVEVEVQGAGVGDPGAEVGG